LRHLWSFATPSSFANQQTPMLEAILSTDLLH
jgi:hypothetical protein